MQVSFSPDEGGGAMPGVDDFGAIEGSSSRYAEPEADGVTPALRTISS